MPLIVKDRVREASVTSGTGTLTLTGSPQAFQTFSSAIGNGNTTYYTITEQGTGNFEVGIGTVGAGTLARTTVLESSNAGALVNFGSATKDVFCTYPAEKSVDIDTPQTLTNKTINASQLVDGSITPAKMANGGAEFGMRNRIINGAMMIDQRNAGASVAPTTAQYLVDRWQLIPSQASKLSFAQNANLVTPPSGFKNYSGFVSASAYAVTSTDYFLFSQKIEGFNTADLAWGTAGAQTITLSFWVRSSLTGTFGFVLRNNAGNRVYPASYTISSANTWEQKTVTIAGDTTGTWLTDNGIGIEIDFGLGVGSSFNQTAGFWTTSGLGVTGATSVVGTSGATFYITGVQLEKGTTATSFDYRPYGTELALCQRYFFNIQTDGTQYATFGLGFASSTTTFTVTIPYPIKPRVPATGITATTAGNFLVQTNSNYTPSSISFLRSNTTNCNINATTTGLTAGQGGHLIDANNACSISFNGMEL
jgi:hypothetical protein